MYCPETIRRLNYENSELRANKQKKINEDLLAIKQAMNRCLEIDAQIITARKLRETHKDREKQLLLAEEFYRKRRSEVISRQNEALSLREAADDYEKLLKYYAEEKFKYEGIVITETSNGNRALLEEAKKKFPELDSMVCQLSDLIAEINDTLQEYSRVYSKDPTYVLSTRDPRNEQGTHKIGRG